MWEEDYEALRPWLEAGVGVPLHAESRPGKLILMGAVAELEDGTYALTERGVRHAGQYDRRLARRLRSPEGKREKSG